MNRNLWVVALLAGALAAPAAPLFAQDEDSFNEVVRQNRTQLEELGTLLKQQHVKVNRLLRLFTDLALIADDLRRQAPATGQDRALQALDKARQSALEEPELGAKVFAVLDRCQVELERNVIGETREATAARFVAEALRLEPEATGELARWLFEAGELRGLRDGADSLAMKATADASQALVRLLSVHAQAADIRPPG